MQKIFTTRNQKKEINAILITHTVFFLKYKNIDLYTHIALFIVMTISCDDEETKTSKQIRLQTILDRTPTTLLSRHQSCSKDDTRTSATCF